MYIEHIRIENFKGIVDRTISFNPRFTVLIGDNGTGKSTILDALAVSLGTVLNQTKASFGINGKKSRPLLPSEIRKVMPTFHNVEYTDVRLSGEMVYNNESIRWEREQKTTGKSLTYGKAKELSNIGKQLLEEVAGETDLPLIAYHSTARLAYEMSSRKLGYEKIGSRMDGYYACLDSRIIKSKFISWFKTFEDSALKFGEDQTLYYAFTEAITSMVPEWKDIKFHWKLDDMVGQQPDGSWMPLSNLSDGYRSVVRLAADIAYRAIKLNPHLGADAIKHTKGVVLIDEIDMHLHPKWQRGIVDNLKNTFPNIQFIATTHSPFIVQSLEAGEVFDLDGSLIDQDPSTMTLEQNALFMGVSSDKGKRFEEQEQLAKEYLAVLEENGSAETEKKEELERLIRNSDDPVFSAKLKMEQLAKAVGK